MKVEGKDGISAEQGAEDEVVLKDDESGEETPGEGQELAAGSKQDKPAEEDLVGKEDEFRAEMVKRFGEKSDQELVKEVWKAYRNGETTFGQAQAKLKGMEELVAQFGGADVLKRALEIPGKPEERSAGEYPAKIQPLIDQGVLNPNDPIVQLLIDQEWRLEQSSKTIGQQTYERAVQTFNGWLDTAAQKYEYADVAVIREMGLSGAFARMNDAQVQAKIERMAAAQHARVMGLVDSKSQAKLDELKTLNQQNLRGGKPGGGKPLTLTARQAFDKAYSEHIKGDE